MHTYNRNGVQIEQCSGCRGIFLDYGELESLTRLESQWGGQQAPPPPRPAPQAYPAAPAPGLGRPARRSRRPRRSLRPQPHKSFGHMLFSS